MLTLIHKDEKTSIGVTKARKIAKPDVRMSIAQGKWLHSVAAFETGHRFFEHLSYTNKVCVRTLGDALSTF